MSKTRLLYFGVLIGMLSIIAVIIMGYGVLIGMVFGYSIAFVEHRFAKKPKIKQVPKYVPEIEYKYWEVTPKKSQ